MRINTFFYSSQQGLKNIVRNRMFSIASIATMSACIFMFGMFYILVSNVGAMVKDAEDNVAITVFFDEGTSDTRIQEIGEDIKQRTEVKELNFVSAEDAWDKFKEVYLEGNEEYAEGFLDNPLANSANYEIYINDISQQTNLVEYLEDIDGVRSVKRSQSVADTLTEFNRILSLVSAGIILILLCVAIFLINNTVTVGIAVRKEEISSDLGNLIKVLRDLNKLGVEYESFSFATFKAVINESDNKNAKADEIAEALAQSDIIVKSLNKMMKKQHMHQ